MKTSRCSGLLFFAILLPFSAAQALSLDQAYKASAENSRDLKQLRLETESTRLSETKAFAGFMPRLDLTAGHLFTEKFEELEVSFSGSNFVMPAIQPYSSLGLTASFEIFSGFKTMNEVSAAKLATGARQHQLSRAEQRVQTQVRGLFSHALGAQVLVEVTDQNIQTLESHMKDVQSRQRGGISTRFDSLRVEVQLEEARTQKKMAENESAIARAKLFEALSTPDDGSVLEGKLVEDFSHYDFSKIDLKNLNREDRAAQVLETERAQYLAKAANAEWMPKIAVYGSQEWYNNINHSVWDADERFKSAYSLGVSLKWNLYDGGADLANQRQAALATKISQEKLGKLDENIPVNIEESKRKFDYDISNYKAKKISIRKAEEAVRLARGALRAGTLTNTEVLDAVLDLNRAKAAAVRSQIDAIEDLGQLEMALGRTI